MKILFLNNTMILGGGVQKCIYLLSNYFNSDNEVFVASSGGEYLEDLKKKGITHYHIKNPENKNPITILINLITIINIIRKNKIDIVHSHHRMTTFYAKIISKFVRFKLVHSSHLYTNDKAGLTRLTLRNVPIISVSNGVEQGLIENYKLDKAFITTIYNSIEFNLKTENEVMNEEFCKAVTDENFIIGVVSRLEPVKGIDLILEAMKEMANINKEIKVFIFGDGSLKEQFIKFINHNNLSHQIVLVGKVTNIKSYIEKFDLIIQSSYQEGLPLSLIEACSLGIPAIATDIPGTNEVIINELNGILVPTESSDHIKEAILELFNNKKVRKQYSENSIIHYNNHFSQEQYYNGHKNYYIELIGYKAGV